jgi:metallo-beta-lactamase class B
MYRAWILAIFFAPSIAFAAAVDCEQCDSWNRDQAPFRIFGNTYFVGVRGPELRSDHFSRRSHPR